MKKLIFMALTVAVLFNPVNALAKDPIKVTNAKSFKNSQSVVIGSFSIGFLVSKTDQATTGKRGYGGSASIAHSTLEGVNSNDLQAITDAAYADFTAKLTAAGYEIVDHARLVTDPAMAKIKYQPSGIEAGVTFGKDSKARALFFGPTAFGAQPLMEGESGAGLLSGFGAFGPAMAKNTYAIKNKQPILNVSYIVDFASADRYGGAFAMGTSVTVKSQLAIADTLSKVTVTDTKGILGTAELVDPIVVAGAFGDFQDSTSHGEKTGNTVGNLMGALMGGGSSSRKSLTFTASPDQYRLGAINAAERANAAFLQTIQQLR
ncbi:MAG: hypothetical protein ACMG50_08245 [Thermomonas sp.]